MAFAFIVGTVTGSSNSGVSVVTSAIDTTGANLIVCTVVSYSLEDEPTLSDSKGNTWTPLTVQDSTNSSRTRLHYCVNPTVGSGHTFTISGGTTYPGIAVQAFSGAAASPFDQQNGANQLAPTTSLQSGSVTPTQTDELIVTGLGSFSTGAYTCWPPFQAAIASPTSPGNHFGVGMSYQIQTSISAQDAFWTHDQSATYMQAVIATFKSGATLTPVTKSVSDTISLSDSAVFTLEGTGAQLFSDSLSLSETSALALAGELSFSEFLSLSDELSGLVPVGYGLADTLSLVDELGGRSSYFPAFEDTLSLSDSSALFLRELTTQKVPIHHFVQGLRGVLR